MELSENARVIGIDIGASGLRIVRVAANGGSDDSYELLADFPHKGKLKVIGEEITRWIRATVEEFGASGVSFTGSLAESFIENFGLHRCSTIGCHAAGAEPGTKTVIDIGASGARYVDLSGKSPKSRGAGRCAAGTGSFLDEQAAQMELDFERFVEEAGRTRKPAPIGGRCSVFAKSDRVTAGARGFSLQEIARGLHMAVSRTYAANIVKQAVPVEPIVMHCRAAHNPVFRECLEEVLALQPEAIGIPENAAARPALGAARLGAEDIITGGHRRLAKIVSAENLEEIEQYVLAAAAPVDSNKGTQRRNPEPVLKVTVPLPEDPPLPEWGDKRRQVILGIDIGSRSTCILTLDPHTEEILYTDYRNTAGQPLRVTLEGLKKFRDEYGDRAEVTCVATTGSSRDFVRRSINGDYSIDEITAQARGTMYHASKEGKEIAAVFEIGGQDSKFIVLRNGVITQFAMNKICSAGTGTFLEEIARPLNVDYRGEFQQRALQSLNPVPIAARCTVFMRSECQDALRRGESVENILAGVALAITGNYLDTFPQARPLVGRLAGRKHADEYVALQGGTFLNRSIIAAFEDVLGFNNFYVPPYCSMTGALGMALIAREWLAGKKKREPGYATPFNLDNLSVVLPEQSSFECKKCPNRCVVTKVAIPAPDGSKRVVFTGDICERYSSGGENSGAAAEVVPTVPLRNKLVFQAVGSDFVQHAGD